MNYVDASFYKDTFKGTLIPDDVLEHRLMMASHDIDSLTYNRIVKKGIDNLTPFQKEMVKKSICLHAEFLHQYGEFIESPISGYSAGTTSVTFKQGSIAGQDGVATSAKVFKLLSQTGLTVGAFI